MREIEAVNTYIKKCISKTNINLKAARIRWHLKRDEMEKQELSFLPLDSIEAKVASLVKLSKMYLTGSKKKSRETN